MKQYAIYLRKSRADVEAEARGEGETLARHRAALTALAERKGYYIARVYQEIVSGDTIAARPQMQELLKAVEEGQYAGVICNEIDRLGRGDMIDQGMIQRAFAASGTLIITPGKIYNPNNDNDSVFFEMGQFLARMEYRQIKKRLQTGRLRSASEGNYQSGPTPYGYTKTRNVGKSGYTLTINEEQAPVVRMIYSLYSGETGERLGKNEIANRLNAMGYTTQKGNVWTPSAVYCILRNPLYMGDYAYKKHAITQYFDAEGKRHTHRENANAIIAKDAFPAIVGRETWNRVHTIMAGHENPRKNAAAPLTNPLAGLVKCAICGHTMQRSTSPGRVDSIKCTTKGCRNVSCSLSGLERAILEGLEGWTKTYTPGNGAGLNEAHRARESEIAAIRAQIESLNAKTNKLYDYLESGLYTPEVFLQRRTALEAKQAEAQAQLDKLTQTPPEAENIIALIPTIKRVLDAYPHGDTAEKNTLLKSIVDHVDYYKDFDARGRFLGPSEAHVSLRIYPKILPLYR